MTQVMLPQRLGGLSPVELETRFSLVRGDIETVTTYPDGSGLASVRAGVVLPLSSAADLDAHVFARLTAAQAAQWIEVNVTSLATAKTALKRLAEFCVYLRDRG